MDNTNIKLNFATYKDSVHACWIGKNIGGTMGAPYEGKREVLDIQGFSTKKGEIIPNDDLDLQLVWLHAMEWVGPYQLSAKELGECWLSFITPYWHEYGICKTNMRLGMQPPLCGDYHSSWKDSNGAWIRTEIWACMAPGCPEIAAKYAIEDACVDHGSGEGTIAAAFVAAMQSCAFIEKDIRRCIDIALSFIPENARTGTTVRKVIECYDSGVSWLDCRNTVQKMNADIGNGWFEAPSNIGYTVLGLLYGEGDFKKSMITTINCGDDTDCTAATLGATLGILNGTAHIPTDWTEHIGDGIQTLCLAGGVLYNVPKTCSELTDRVIRIAPTVLFANKSDLSFTDGESIISENPFSSKKSAILERLKKLKPYQFEADMGMVKAIFNWDRSPDIAPGDEIGLTLSLQNNTVTFSSNPFGNISHFVSLRWILPEGFSVDGNTGISVDQLNAHTSGKCSTRFTIRVGEKVAPINRLILEIALDDRPGVLYVPMVLIG
ncbi:MAG: ADP-ribosylglycohydrolase family protein [Clostridia bacterium]|nr:ADP-ribosylglycohydrolase family protein [Clostridia bacterium]